ncbi:hypothetical protein [Ponticaulis koreensis]|uniref:hypothetical protein n=1 Tax=Ponticaulis koreensis TaxID=1123045 RepID=UPI0003B500E1|nr:hypothetical protein [Ponticaulis koreensis]
MSDGVRARFTAQSQAPAPDIKTRLELDKLKAERAKAKPQPQRQLTPKGPIRMQVLSAEASKSHARLGQLKTALEQAKQEAARQYSLNSRAGFAKAQFDKGR